MSWDDLMKHGYLNYDFTKYMEKEDQNKEDDLLLSYNEESGIYSALMANDPHAQLNEKNAILINTKDPMYY